MYCIQCNAMRSPFPNLSCVRVPELCRYLCDCILYSGNRTLCIILVPSYFSCRLTVYCVQCNAVRSPFPNLSCVRVSLSCKCMSISQGSQLLGVVVPRTNAFSYCIVYDMSLVVASTQYCGRHSLVPRPPKSLGMSVADIV